MKDQSPSPLSWLLPAGAAAAIVIAYGLFLASSSSKEVTAAPPAPSATASAKASSASAAATRLDLVGVVEDSGGQAIANATIFIYTAQPRSGPGFL